MRRRTFLALGALGVPALALGPRVLRAADDAAARLAQLERRHGGRLGVSILDTGSGRHVGHRADERFLMCSTFKLLLAGCVLARVDAGRERLQRRVIVHKQDLLAWAPVTGQHVGAPGMSLAQLCEAAVTVSDNTAANLLLGTVGGPAAVTRFVRGFGDPVTRLDRREPDLNVSAGPDDLRDTTTPAAMRASLGKLVYGSVLAPASRARLVAWMRACTTGTTLLRAGLPEGWAVGDKTGSGAQGERNDVAFVEPPGRAPLLVAAYYRAAAKDDTEQAPRVLSAVGRLVATL